ncbi:MAG: hypothetical protein ABEI86_12450 [Halobacteriaceae archaeon]
MTGPTVKSVNFAEYKTGIKETWLQGYFDWGLEELEMWINEQARAGNDDFVELADKNWQSALTSSTP